MKKNLKDLEISLESCIFAAKISEVNNRLLEIT